MPTLSIQFTNSNRLYTILIEPPEFGYRSTIQFPFEQVESGDGKLKHYDYGSGYDVRSCECTMNVNNTDQETLYNFLNNQSATRQDNSIYMTLQSGSGFFPFGPDYGDAGTFEVSILNPNFQGIGDQPYKYFRTNLSLIRKSGPDPVYSLPTDVKDGSWTFGTISDCRFPQNWFKPDIQLSYHGSIAMDSEVDLVDNNSTSDVKKTQFTMQSNHAKASRIINYLSSTARANPFTITVPDYFYPFGKNEGSNKSFFVKLGQKTINIRHQNFNTFEFELMLHLES